MIKPNHTLLLLGLIALVAVSGCLGGGQEPTVAFVGGTNGLTVSFIDLPEQILAGIPFQLAVMVQNEGEATVASNKASLVLNGASNFNINIYDPSLPHIKRNKEILFAARIVNNTVIPGGREFIPWMTADGQSPSFQGGTLTEEQPVPVAVDVCYPYSSRAVTMACIGRTTKECNPIEEKKIESSGAPIQITNFKQVAQAKDAANVILRFTVDVENQGEGDVFAPIDPNILSHCASMGEQNVVNLSTVRLGKNNYTVEDPQCTRVDLSDNTGTTSCSITVPATSDYQDELSLTFEYGYKQKITTEVAVIPP